MGSERTLAIIKPDAMARRLESEILKRIREAGFKIVAQKTLRLSKEEAEGFYAVHRGKAFFEPLTNFMSSGQVVVMVLEAEGAIARWREVMGATDPAQAAPGTIRKEFGSNIQNNCTHGSDSAETAAFEIGYFFSAPDLL
ncbi:MAG: nucleoside-diphosphate kinase [Terriglobia bacterium]